MIFFVKRLRDIFVERFLIFCGGCVILLLRCCVILVWRGCVIYCVERLCDFSYSLTHSFRLHDLFLWRLRKFFCQEVA